MAGHLLVDLGAAPTAGTMGPQVIVNAAEARAPAHLQEAIVLGLRGVGHVVALTAKMMDLLAFVNAVAVQARAPAVDRQGQRDIGTAVVEHVEESGKLRAQIQDANFRGALPNVCLITQLLELLAIPQVQLSSRLQLRETQSGKVARAVESVSYSLLLQVER